MYWTWLLCVTFLSYLNVFHVDSMTLKGPVLTRYDPCGLGVIHFDRIRERYWKGVLHFSLYSHLIEVDTTIFFETPVDIYVVSYLDYLAKKEIQTFMIACARYYVSHTHAQFKL